MLEELTKKWVRMGKGPPAHPPRNRDLSEITGPKGRSELNRRMLLHPSVLVTGGLTTLAALATWFFPGGYTFDATFISALGLVGSLFLNLRVLAPAFGKDYAEEALDERRRWEEFQQTEIRRLCMEADFKEGVTEYTALTSAIDQMNAALQTATGGESHQTADELRTHLEEARKEGFGLLRAMLNAHNITEDTDVRPTQRRLEELRRQLERDDLLDETREAIEAEREACERLIEARDNASGAKAIHSARLRALQSALRTAALEAPQLIHQGRTEAFGEGSSAKTLISAVDAAREANRNLKELMSDSPNRRRESARTLREKRGGNGE
jgi:hypothetical protein